MKALAWGEKRKGATWEVISVELFQKTTLSFILYGEA
jgi:hypothetical protein